MCYWYRQSCKAFCIETMSCLASIAWCTQLLTRFSLTDCKHTHTYSLTHPLQMNRGTMEALWPSFWNNPGTGRGCQHRQTSHSCSPEGLFPRPHSLDSVLLSSFSPPLPSFLFLSRPLQASQRSWKWSWRRDREPIRSEPSQPLTVVTAAAAAAAPLHSVSAFGYSTVSSGFHQTWRILVNSG